MNSRRDQSIAVNNRDIDPSDQLAIAYPDLACLIHNDAISAAFARFEKAAVRWKRIYAFSGRISLIAILLAMIQLRLSDHAKKCLRCTSDSG